MGSSPPWAKVTAVQLSGCSRLLTAGPVRAPVSSHATSELKLDRHQTAPPPAQALSPCPDLGSLPCPALIMVGTTLMNSSLQDFWLILNSSLFSMIYLEPRLLLMYDFRKGWRLDLSHVINFACTQNLFLLRSCFPNTLVCFAALSSFGGVGGVILKAALVGVLGGIVVEFFLEGEMRLLKKECIHISSSSFLFFLLASSSFQCAICCHRSKRGISLTFHQTTSLQTLHFIGEFSQKAKRLKDLLSQLYTPFKESCTNFGFRIFLHIFLTWWQPLTKCADDKKGWQGEEDTCTQDIVALWQSACWAQKCTRFD